MPKKLVEIAELRVDASESGLNILDGINLSVTDGQILGIVGESGSGKSMLIRSVLGLLPRGVEISGASSILLEGQEIVGESLEFYQTIWGQKIGFIPQDPMTSLNPVRKIGDQLSDGMRIHLGMSKRDARKKAVEQLASVGIRDGERIMDSYPHELSGGMRQRVLIAMAIALEPKLLIADEPTTALDVTIQKQILELLKELRERLGLAIIIVSHDLALMEEFCDEIAVMYCGRIAERIKSRDLSSDSKHPYTRALAASHPDLDLPSGVDLETIQGESMSFKDRGLGCAFAPRCTRALEQCWVVSPSLETVAEGHEVACYNPVA